MSRHNKKIHSASITKKYIAQEATKFIEKIEETYSETNMVSFVSKTQINSLIRVLNGSGKLLSCHSLIILHSIFEILKTRGGDCAYLSELASTIYSFAKKILETQRENELALFLVDCYSPVKRELSSSIFLMPSMLPNIGKRKPKI